VRHVARSRGKWSLGLIALVGLVASSGLTATATGAGAAAATDPGVTAKDVTIGYIYSGTGLGGSTFKNAGKAFQARIDRQNANGGVNGRRIKAVIRDDQTSANLTDAQDLVRNQHVFAVVNNSPVAYLSWRFLLASKVPMIGGGFDGSYYRQPGNEDIISALGNGTPEDGLTYDQAVRVMKMLGAKKVAALAYSSSPSSSASAQALQDWAVPGLGLKAVYTNTSVDFGSSDVGPLVLGIKQSGADAVYLPMVASTNFAVVQGLQQNGVAMKANVLATGYGQDLLDSPIAKTLGPNTVVLQTYKPVELKTKATKQFQADLKKYAGLTGVPDYGQYTGYIAGELAILGLEHAGATPTRRGFIDGLHNLGTYDEAGLACEPTDISLTNRLKSRPTGCVYFLQVKDGKFVMYPKGNQPVIGKLVGDPAKVKSVIETAPAASGTTTSTSTP
jgi:branched-chain amino acid transport system substrate-binding protein